MKKTTKLEEFLASDDYNDAIKDLYDIIYDQFKDLDPQEQAIQDIVNDACYVLANHLKDFVEDSEEDEEDEEDSDD